MDIFERAKKMMAVPTTQMERLDTWLRDWAAWVRSGREGPEKSKASGAYGSGGINCWNDMEENDAMMKFRAIDSCIDGMDPIAASALSDHYTGTSIFKWRQSFTEALDRGRQAMLIGLAKRNILI